MADNTGKKTEPTTQPEMVWNGEQLWGNCRPRWDIMFRGVSPEERHLLAGACLLGDSEGFTPDDVKGLLHIAGEIRRVDTKRDADFLTDTARRINGLLYPDDRIAAPFK